MAEFRYARNWKRTKASLDHDVCLDRFLLLDFSSDILRPFVAPVITRNKEGERLLEEMKREGKYISVETKTALMKGYSHSGDIAKVDALFHSMCASKCEYRLRFGVIGLLLLS